LLNAFSFCFLHLFDDQRRLHLSHKVCVSKRGIPLNLCSDWSFEMMTQDPHILDLAVKSAEFMRVTFMVLIEHTLKGSQSIQMINVWLTRDDFRSNEQFWLFRCLEEFLTSNAMVIDCK
jgi:hypothetical protein